MFYTDGVTEARASNGEFYGRERLERNLALHARESAQQLCDSIVKSVNDFQTHQRHDDVTLMVLRRKM